MEFLSAIVGPVVESLLVPVKRHLGYLLSSPKYVSNLTTKMEQLHDTSIDVKNHMETNNIYNLEIPTHVPVWLQKVEKIKEDAETISSNVNGCFNLKMRYRAGRKAFKTTQEIQGLIQENIDTTWSDAPKPLGKVCSNIASTSDGDAENYFKSRDKIFKEALGFLQQDHKAQVIALCGMGGVGKTTMMEQLKKAVEDKKMFHWVVKVVIGEKTNTFSIQQTVAEYLQIPLTETSNTARADRLRVTFGKISQDRKEKVLVVLDDVWENVELKDIGLSPLPNGFKLLLTSRHENVCTQIAVEDDSDLRVVRVNVMEELEANSFFFQISKVSNPELKDIGVKIVKRCGFLPLAIKLIATNLRSQEKSVWNDTLHRLKENDLDENVQRIIEISYTFIRKEDVKAIFLLCGLFPDDFNIRIDDLTRYAWGLNLLNAVPTLGHARDRTKTCVLDLKNANLLMDSDSPMCVKMHDLVLAFVVGKVSKGDDPWIINHGDVSNWSRAEMNESCRRISLTCMGMSEFPRDFNYPNVSLLRLMNGDESLEIPEDFLQKMENLQVMACENLQHPLLPRSLQCSTKLRTLCLDGCSLMSDCSPIGDHLLNLEVLSFAYCGIRHLPSAIGNLVKLKLLDLTECVNLCIDEGVLKNLIKLEELYMTVRGHSGVKFTDINYKELAERSKNLSAFDFEFFENNPESKNMSYNKLERFSISMGRFLVYGDGVVHRSDNRLMLVANKDELLESGMNVLFPKTEVLYLEAGRGMSSLEEVLPKSVPRQNYSFYNLRVLSVSGCADLRCLFTVPTASGLVKLEHLTIEDCDAMEALVYGDNGEEGGVIRFQELKYLRLVRLANLAGFSNMTNVVMDLPQLMTLDLDGLPNITSIFQDYKSAVTTSVMPSSSTCAIKPFFNKQVMIPRLVTLSIYRMEALKNIWPPACGSSEEVTAGLLRDITVHYCHNLLNLFPSKKSEEENNESDERFQESSEAGVVSWSLCQYSRQIFINDCNALSTVIPFNSVGKLQKLEILEISRCQSMREIFEIEGVNKSCHSTNVGVGCGDIHHAVTIPRAVNMILLELPNLQILIINQCDLLEYVFTSSTLESLKQLKELTIEKCKAMQVVVKEDGEHTTSKVVVFHHLKSLTLTDLPNVKGFFLGMNEFQWPLLDKVKIFGCPQMMVFTSGHSMTPKLNYMHTGLGKHSLECGLNFQLTNASEETQIRSSSSMCSTPPPPDMIKLQLQYPCSFSNLVEVGTDLYSQPSERRIFFPHNELHKLQNLEKLNFTSSIMAEEVFEVVEEETNDYYYMNETQSSVVVVVFPKLKQVTLVGLRSLKHIWKSNRRRIVLSFPNLTKVSIYGCPLLGNVFTSCMIGSLSQLQELHIGGCGNMEVVVKQVEEEDSDTRANEVVEFPRLKSLTLFSLENLKGFYLGPEAFMWPSLDTLVIKQCPQITVFTSGQSTTPKLKVIGTTNGSCDATQDPNSFIKTKLQEGWEF